MPGASFLWQRHWLGPDETGTSEDGGCAKAGHDGGEAKTHLQGGVGDGANTELTDDAVSGATPSLTAGRALERMLSRSKSVQ